MQTNNNDQDLLNAQVSFTQHFLPGLDAGEYQLTVTQQVADSTGKPVKPIPYQANYTFAVAGDRFGFTNAGNVLNSVFPPDNASGEFSNVLPHVVFLQNTFPWIRYPTSTLPYAPPPPGTDIDADVPTWLWVMILDETDVANYPTLNLTPIDCTIGDLFPNTVVPPVSPTSSLGNNYSYFQGATDLSALEPGQKTTDAIKAIDVPLSLIWKIAPTIADLRQMAHGRTVSLINQPTSGIPLGQPLGTFSIAFGNRLPATGKKTHAFLVSLEELEPFLPNAAGGGAPSGNTFTGTLNLRLAVLKSWSFFSTGQPATFINQLEQLNGNTPGSITPVADTNLRLPYSGTNTVVAGALNMGFVPLNETLRTAGQTVSWYRGPLAPYLVQQNNIKKLPIPSPDAATIFDPTTGMLDVSYASAWTIGRMVALQDVSFSTALYNWKKSLGQQVASTLQKMVLDRSFGYALDQSPGVQKMKSDGSTTSSFFKRTVQALNTEE
ncbi:MAG TPA: hypothetical protein VK826_08250 [Bacteroidia bacterium]|nr:hypothetical protein [Bacteroidia bacterium]